MKKICPNSEDKLYVYSTSKHSQKIPRTWFLQDALVTQSTECPKGRGNCKSEILKQCADSSGASSAF